MEASNSRGAHAQAYKDKSKPTDIRSSNINAGKGKHVSHKYFCSMFLHFDRLSKARVMLMQNITLYSNARRRDCSSHVHLVH